MRTFRRKDCEGGLNLGQSKRNKPAGEPAAEEKITIQDGDSKAAQERDGEEEITISLAEYEDLKSELQDLKDGMLRAAADYDNFRKRMEKERENIICYANEQLISELLPVLDNLERALASEHTDTGIKSILEGVKMISGHLHQVLTRCGLESLSSEGQPFDPNIHEAVGVVETGEHKEGTVVTELQKGYKLLGKVIRPSVVHVSGPKAGEAEEED